MTTVTGGLRARFLHDSLAHVLEAGLTGLGWFDAGRRHLPLQILHGPHHWEIPVALNSLVMTSLGAETEEIELGSRLSTEHTVITADLYAQSDSLGIEVTNDMRDLLRGRVPGGATNGVFPILDFRTATPEPVGLAVVQEVGVQRSIVQVPEEWARHVFTLSVRLDDTYY